MNDLNRQRRPRAPRYQVPGFSVIYDEGESYWTAPVINASRSGLFIETTHQVPVGTRMSIVPHGDHDEHLPFELTGTVVRVDELDLDNNPDGVPGIALRLDELSDDVRSKLDCYLAEHGVMIG